MFYKMEEMVRNRALKINNKANSSLNSRNRDPLFNIFAEFVSNSNFNRPACCQTEKGNLRERVSERQTKEKERCFKAFQEPNKLDHCYHHTTITIITINHYLIIRLVLDTNGPPVQMTFRTKDNEFSSRFKL
ncbi:hypothetical protein V9T40_006496 [Parthenolecanium corni]|uniref:Uncharacterized protein n=1 Tax=Parthenolecanium corni TaxID=536013 RepID=A0AAN9TK17_9HEMI